VVELVTSVSVTSSAAIASELVVGPLCLLIKDCLILFKASAEKFKVSDFEDPGKLKVILFPSLASEDNTTDDNEFKIPLNASEAKEGKSITFNLPGSSKSLTLNFSADALNKMRQSFISKQSGPTTSSDAIAAEDVTETEVTSSTTQNVRKKSAFSCQLCSKFFP
jgi:hypothetical protein